MLYILMYSGGIDSVLCLKLLREQGIIPALFHFHTGKTKRKHERMIRKTAKLLSPESSYYVWKVKTSGYHAFWCYNGEYHVKMNDRGKVVTFMPKTYGDVVVIGYTGYDSNDARYKLPNQREFIKICKERNYPFMFPLAGLRRRRVLEMFNSFPKEIRKNTVSSTRFRDKGDWTLVRKK